MVGVRVECDMTGLAGKRDDRSRYKCIPHEANQHEASIDQR